MGEAQRIQQGSPPKERSTKNSRNRKKSGGRGGKFNPNFFVEKVEQPRVCKYCKNDFWCLEQSRQQYCTPKTERKLYMYRKYALIELAYDLLRWRGVLKAWVVKMIDAAHDAVLTAIRYLGWWWNSDTRKFEFVGGLTK